MIDAALLSLIVDALGPKEGIITQEEERGSLLHSKQAGRYEVVKKLPKEAESFNRAFDYADAFGTLRIASIHHYAKLDDIHSQGFAVGGRFGFDTAAWNNVKLRMAVTTSQWLPDLNPSSLRARNGDFFNADKEGFAYLSKASVAYADTLLAFQAGRIALNTPYADEDDIRMAANSFEGAWGAYTGEALTLQGFYAKRWAGYDSGEAQDMFKPLATDAEGENGWGMAGGGLRYEYAADSEAGLWYYRIDHLGDIAYAEASGNWYLPGGSHVEYGLQYSHLAEASDSGMNGNVVGAMGLIDIGTLFGGFSYNYAFIDEGNTISDGFGGGPYYTSLDESTIAMLSEEAPGSDVRAYRLGVGVNLTWLTGYDLVFEGVHGHIEALNSVSKHEEEDLIVTYTADEKVSVESVFSTLRDDTLSGEDVSGYTRWVIRMDYRF